MPRTRKETHPTRQIYASVREDIYLAAKAKAAELRLPMKRFIEVALTQAINSDSDEHTPLEVSTTSQVAPKPTSIWDDQYIAMQVRQPLGAPLKLSADEAKNVALNAFRTLAPTPESPSIWAHEHLYHQTQTPVGSPVRLTEDDAASIARTAFLHHNSDANGSA